MTRSSVLRIVFHGGILLLIGMLVGFPGFCFGPPRTMDDELRLFFRQSHLIPIAQGTWMVAIAGILPYLSLTDRGSLGIVWSLITSAYALVIAQMTWGLALWIGWRQPYEPILKSPLAPVYAGALILVAGGVLVATFLITRGAFVALRQLDEPVRNLH